MCIGPQLLGDLSSLKDLDAERTPSFWFPVSLQIEEAELFRKDNSHQWMELWCLSLNSTSTQTQYITTINHRSHAQTFQLQHAVFFQTGTKSFFNIQREEHFG